MPSVSLRLTPRFLLLPLLRALLIPRNLPIRLTLIPKLLLLFLRPLRLRSFFRPYTFAVLVSLNLLLLASILHFTLFLRLSFLLVVGFGVRRVVAGAREAGARDSDRFDCYGGVFVFVDVFVFLVDGLGGGEASEFFFGAVAVFIVAGGVEAGDVAVGLFD
jgi:hypothetical protein